jgi:hypothetical protein
MEGEMMSALNKHGEIFDRLGDREPQTVIEAQAVLENIRAEKGLLDAEILGELRTLSSHALGRILGMAKSHRETEAAYTTR